MTIVCSLIFHELSGGAVTVSQMWDRTHEKPSEHKLAQVFDRILHHASREVLAKAEGGALTEGKEDIEVLIRKSIEALAVEPF